MARKKFTRYTQGRNQQVFVPKPIALSNQSTLAGFIANAAAGTLGLYDDSNAVISGAIGATVKFSFVLKHSDGSIRKSTQALWSDVTASKKLYTAGVKCQGSIGYNSSIASSAMNLAAAVATGKFYELGIIETTEGNQPYPTWNFEYVAAPGDTEQDVVQGLVKQINDTTNIKYKGNSQLVSARAVGAATYSSFTLGGTGPTATFTNGSAVVTLAGTSPVFNGAVGDFLAVSADGTTQPVSANTASQDIYKIIAVSAGVSFTLNRAFQGTTITMTQAQVQGTLLAKTVTFTATGIIFTDLQLQENFSLVVRQELQYATITNKFVYTYGVGLPEQIYELELEGNTYAGNTAGNTVYGNEAFGNPDKFGAINGDTETYDMFMLLIRPKQTLTAIPNEGFTTLHVTIAAPKSAGGLTASLQTALGV